MLYTAKSVILDIATNHGDAALIGLRSVEFKLGGVLVDVAAIDCTVYGSARFGAQQSWELAFYTALLKTGSNTDRGWLATSTGSERLICVFNTPIEFDEVVVNNFHTFGATVTAGVNAVSVWISSDAITSTVFDEAISNSSKIFDDVFTIHPAVDAAADETIALISIGAPLADVAMTVPGLTPAITAAAGAVAGIVSVVPGVSPAFSTSVGRSGDLAIEVPELAVGFTRGADAVISLPDISFESTATDGLLGSLQVALFPPTFTALCGARVAQAVPSLELGFTATVGNTADLAMALPAWTFAATGTVNTLADINFVVPKITAALVGVPQPTAAVLIEYPRISVSFSGTLGGVGGVAAVLPSIDAALTAYHEPIADLAVTLNEIKVDLHGVTNNRFCSETLEYGRPT